MKRIPIPVFVALGGYLLALIGVFLPFYTANAEYRVELELLGYSNLNFFTVIKMATDLSTLAESNVGGLIRNLIIFGIFLVEAVISTLRGKMKAAITGSIFLIVMNIFININMSGLEELYNHSVGFYFMWAGVILALLGNILTVVFLMKGSSSTTN